MNWLDKLIIGFQRALGPINKLPTWANEPITAFVVMPFLLHWAPNFALGVFALLSFLYEKYIDPWGYNEGDILWRLHGATLVQVLYLIARSYYGL